MIHKSSNEWGKKASLQEKALVIYTCFVKEKRHDNYISIAMNKYFLVEETRACKSILSSLPLREETAPMSLLGEESVAEATSCLLVSMLPFFLSNRLDSMTPVNRLYFPVSCAALGVVMWPSSDQRGANWSAAWGSVRRLTKRSWLHWEMQLSSFLPTPTPCSLHLSCFPEWRCDDWSSSSHLDHEVTMRLEITGQDG